MIEDLAPPAEQARPHPPPSSGPFILPLLAIVAGTAIAGAVAGSIVLVWGAFVGGIAAVGLAWAGLLRQGSDYVVPVVAGAIGLAIVQWTLDGRAGPIDFLESARASVGWLLVGAGFAYVLWQADEGLGLRAAIVSALAWGVGGFIALQWGSSIGYLDELSNRAVEAGEVQELTRAFYAWSGAVAAAIGAGGGLALHVGTATLAAIGGSVVFTVFAANKIAFSIGELISQAGRFGELAQQFWPPQWTWPDFAGMPDELQILDPMIETIQIAIVGATVGCAVAIPIAFLASRPTTYNGPIYGASRTIMNVLRTIPDLFWGIFFATAVGFGTPFAGALAMVMFSMSIMAKLFSETIDTIDPGPLEAARATGSKHSQMVQYSAMPQVLPNYVAYALYIFELNIRASVVIGLVGAGGIGLLLNEQRSFFQWDRVMAIVLVIFAAVILIELVSIAIRRRLV